MGKTAVNRLLKMAKPFAANRNADDAEAASTEPDMDALASAIATELAADHPASTDAPGNSDAAIASIFALIRSGPGSEAIPESELPEDTGATFDLLSELDRLWGPANA
jgi:hypothetical protein